MSTEASLFVTYFGIGLILMILVFISERAKRGLEMSDPFVDAGPIAAGVLIFIALFWPVWLIYLLCRKRDDHPPEK